MDNSRIVWKNQRELRTGYTTGSCAAAAAKAAAHMLLSGAEIRQISLLTPAGIRLYLDVEEIRMETEKVSCAVRKDSGDDPDVTNGISVYAEVRKSGGQGVRLEAGVGIGRVTRPGLEQAVGEAAINSVPRRMITEAVQEEQSRFGYAGGLTVEISIPEGAELAGKTFNPRLGIEGGISVLGTSGIVEPMSEQAITRTIFLEMKLLKENGCDYCYVVPGNYGADFLRRTEGFDDRIAVKCSNYIGEAIDDAVRLEMKGILLAGHIGKLVKLAAGVMNTHSRQADGRMEVLGVHAAMAGAGPDVVRQVMRCVTTEEAVGLLKRCGVWAAAAETILERIEYHLRQRAGKDLQIGAVVFANDREILGRTTAADELSRKIRRETKR